MMIVLAPREGMSDRIRDALLALRDRFAPIPVVFADRFDALREIQGADIPDPPVPMVPDLDYASLIAPHDDGSIAGLYASRPGPDLGHRIASPVQRAGHSDQAGRRRRARRAP